MLTPEQIQQAEEAVSETPITDAAAFNLATSPQGAPHKDYTPKGALVDADVALKLERECIQLRRDLETAREERNRAALKERQKWMPHAAQVAKLREALGMFVGHYPSGMNPYLDRAWLKGHAALSDPAPPVVLESEAEALRAACISASTWLQSGVRPEGSEVELIKQLEEVISA